MSANFVRYDFACILLLLLICHLMFWLCSRGLIACFLFLFCYHVPIQTHYSGRAERTHRNAGRKEYWTVISCVVVVELLSLSLSSFHPWTDLKAPPDRRHRSSKIVLETVVLALELVTTCAYDSLVHLALCISSYISSFGFLSHLYIIYLCIYVYCFRISIRLSVPSFLFASATVELYLLRDIISSVRPIFPKFYSLVCLPSFDVCPSTYPLSLCFGMFRLLLSFLFGFFLIF